MAGKSIGELNGRWAAWFRILLGIIAPMGITYLIAFTVHIVTAIQSLETRMATASECQRATVSRVENIEAANAEQWRTMNQLNGRQQAADAEIVRNTRDIDRLRAGQGG